MTAEVGGLLDATSVGRTRRAGDGAMTAKRSVQAAFLILIVLVVTLVVAAGFAVHRMYTLGNTRYLQQAAPLYAATQDVLVQMLNQETSVRGYVITGDLSTLAPYKLGRVREQQELDQIAASAASDPRIPQQLVAVRREVNALESYFAEQVALVRQGEAGQHVAQQQVLNGKAHFDHFRTLALALEADAGRVVARAQSEQHDTFVKTLIFLAITGMLVLLIAAGLLVRIPSRLYRLYRAEEGARRAAEEGAEAARALSHVSEAVVLADDTNTVRYWNPAAAALFGHPPDAAIGRPVDALAPVLADLTADGASGVSPVTLEGQQRWLSAAESHFPGGRVVVVRDLTGDHELERVRSEFVATAAHELRTPLAAIYGAVRTIRRDDYELSPEVQEQFLTMIERESERLKELMDQLLVTAQLDRDSLHVRSEAVDVGELCRSIIDSAELRIPDSIQLAAELAPTPVTVRADPERLRQAIGNLLDNAIKYSPNGGRIELRTSRREGEGVIEVSDEGIGIPPDEQERIFEKFYRLDPSMTRGVGGSGLGLYIIRELIAHMHGSVSVESELDRGATFTITLPLA
ncbi:MAG TPA: ATP-binding protein [Gaiellaceae bacterium]